MQVEVNHQTFSSEAKIGGIAIQDMQTGEGALELEMFIAMDPPKHDAQRKAVSPAVAPSNLVLLEPIIRERAGLILDSLPIGEEIDWVDRVSVELTTMTLATLFDFPWEERRKLTRWSDVATATPETGVVLGTAPRGTSRMRVLFQGSVGQTHQRVSEVRSDLDDGALAGDAGHAIP